MKNDENYEKKWRKNEFRQKNRTNEMPNALVSVFPTPLAAYTTLAAKYIQRSRVGVLQNADLKKKIFEAPYIMWAA